MRTATLLAVFSGLLTVAYAARCAQVYSPDPPKFRHPRLDTFELWASDFTHGTKRLTEPGIYKFMEDVQFNPNRESNWYPVCTGVPQTEYCGEHGPSKAYQLGFFAGITIESEDIHVDLNGHTFSQHPEHALQQRFFALIELASQPFIPNQGPAATEGGFGSTINACRECSVTNGVLGRSSHHGIHGNGAEDFAVEKVVFEDYEVAAISCNGCKRVEIIEVEAKGTFQQIPVRATYSAARFMTIFWNAIKSHVPDGEAKTEIQAKNDALESAMQVVYAEVIDGATNHIETAEIKRQFALPEVDGMRLVDGNTYGMTFHSNGVLVGPFTTAFLGEHSPIISKDIRIADTVIKNTMGHVNEVVGYLTADGAVSVDVAGGTVRMSEIMDPETGAYVPDLLHDMRFALAYWSDPEGGNETALVYARAKKRLGTINIPIELVKWARDGEALPTEDRFMCNIDSMNHKQKGVIGLFLQQVFRAELERVVVQNTVNYGAVGSDACGNYWAQPDGHFGYTGSQVRGVAVAGSKMVSVHDFDVVTVRAESGSAYGIHAFNDVQHLCLSQGDVAAVESKWVPPGGSPNTPLTKHYSLMDAGVVDVSTIGVRFFENPEDAIHAEL